MGTRSIIISITNNVAKTIYCHWDGYPSNNGKILLEHYTDPKKVASLIRGGFLSSLRQCVSVAELDKAKIPHHKFGEIIVNGEQTFSHEAPHTGEHSYDDPINGVCVFYRRDRGEKKAENTAVVETLPEGFNLNGSTWFPKPVSWDCEYAYANFEGKWYLMDLHKKNPVWKKLTTKACMKD